MEICFATGNINKLKEAQKVLDKIRYYHFEHRELRSDNLEEIAKDKVYAAYSQLKKPVFVEDTGLFISSLNGFPGTYSGWAFKKIGIKGILKLMKGNKKRNAYFETCIVYYDGKEAHVFKGKCDGLISNKARGNSGFGYDPIFIPRNCSQTFAESKTLKNKLSHRYKSLLKLSQFLELNKE